jgi:hypothetical protein
MIVLLILLGLLAIIFAVFSLVSWAINEAAAHEVLSK